MDYFQQYFNNFPELGLPTFLQNIVDKFSYVGLVSTPTESNQFSEDAEERFFLVIYNSSTTVSAAYATFIVLAISFALAAVFGALYYSLATSSSSSGYGGYSRRKRSFDYNNNTEEGAADQIYLLKILELLSSYTENVSSNQQNKNCLLHQVCDWAATKPISQIKWLNNLKFLEKNYFSHKKEKNNVLQIIRAIKVGQISNNNKAGEILTSCHQQYDNQPNNCQISQL